MNLTRILAILILVASNCSASRKAAEVEVPISNSDSSKNDETAVDKSDGTLFALNTWSDRDRPNPISESVDANFSNVSFTLKDYTLAWLLVQHGVPRECYLRE